MNKTRAAAGSAVVSVRLPPDLLAVLDEVQLPAKRPGRPEAIRYALRDWAIGQGMITASLDGPEGAN